MLGAATREWHCEAMTERARPFPTNEKAPVSQRTKSPERREPVISVTGHPWYHSLCCAQHTAALHDRLFGANRCPDNGGLPSGPTVCFSPAAQGPVTETLCTRLAPPGGSLYAEEIRFFPVNAFVLFSKWTKFSMIRRQCQAVWLILKMKQFHKRRGRIFQNCARVDSMHFTVDSCRRSSGGGASVI